MSQDTSSQVDTGDDPGAGTLSHDVPGHDRPGKLTLTEIAKALGVTVGRASQMKKQGMPVDSIEAARVWKLSRVQTQFQIHQGQQTKQQAAALSAQAYDLAQIRAKREHHEAAIAEIKERQMAGELIEIEKVKTAMSNLSAQVRMAFEKIPDKLSPRLAAETETEKIRGLLIDEIQQVLADLAQSAARLSGGDYGRD